MKTGLGAGIGPCRGEKRKEGSYKTGAAEGLYSEKALKHGALSDGGNHGRFGRLKSP